MSRSIPVGHIRSYRLSLFVSLGSPLSLKEHAHLADCDECTRSLKKYLQADSSPNRRNAPKRADDGFIQSETDYEPKSIG